MTQRIPINPGIPIPALRVPESQLIADHLIRLTKITSFSSYWFKFNKVRGPTYIFDREARLNGSDITECDIMISTLARQFYFGDTIDQDDLKQFINLNSDVQFWYGTDKLIKVF